MITGLGNLVAASFLLPNRCTVSTDCQSYRPRNHPGKNSNHRSLVSSFPFLEDRSVWDPPSSLISGMLQTLLPQWDVLFPQVCYSFFSSPMSFFIFFNCVCISSIVFSIIFSRWSCSSNLLIRVWIASKITSICYFVCLFILSFAFVLIFLGFGAGKSCMVTSCFAVSTIISSISSSITCL